MSRPAASWLALLALFATCAKRPPVPSGYGLSPGDRRVYEIDYRTASKADLRVLFEGRDPAGTGASPAALAEPRSYKTLLRGRLVMTVLEKGPEGLLCAYRIEHPQLELELEGNESPVQAGTIATLLGRETFARMDPKGRLRGVLLVPQADSMTRGFVLALLAKTQFVLPADPRPGATTWTAEEEDPSGRYRARYESGASFEGRNVKSFPEGLAAFRKTKETYLPAVAAAKPLLARLPTAVEPSGATEMVFDANGGFLEASAGSETDRVTVSGREVARVESRFSLRRVGGGTAPPSERLALLEAFRWRRTAGDFIPLTMALSEEESELAIQRTALGQATFESLKADLTAAETAVRKPALDLYLKFKALIYLHPEVAADLGEALAAAPAESVTRDIIGGALGAVGHPEAQAALAKALLSRIDGPAFAMGLIQALSQVRFPTGPAVRALQDVAAGAGDESLSAAALLGLGTMSRSLKETDPVRAERIAEDLIATRRPSMTERAMDVLLKAMGNSGSDKAIPLMREFIEHGSARLRASAAAGLRFVDSGEADPILAGILASDEDALVRTSALLALGFRKPTAETAEAHIRAVSQDASEAVRLAALSNLGNMTEEFPEVLAVIRRVAEEDDSESIRKTAANILSTRGGDNKKRS